MPSGACSQTAERSRDYSKDKKAFLSQIDLIVDWKPLCAIIEKAYTKRRKHNGRPCHSPLVLFNVELLRTWYGLSDAEVESQVNDRLSFSRFVGIALDDSAPTEPACVASIALQSSLCPNVWNEGFYLGKQRTNVAKMSPRHGTPIFAGRFAAVSYYYINHGKWLFEQKDHRNYDAYTTLERAFYYLRPRLSASDENTKSLFNDISNDIGICLSCLGREDEASFYFRQTDEDGLLCDQANQALAHHRNQAEHTASSRCDDRLTIGYALSVLLGLKKMNLAPCMFVYDTTDGSFLQRIEDQDAIVDYTLNDENAKDKVFVLSCSHAHYLTGDERDKSILCPNAPVIISTHAIHGDNSSSIMRVDVVRCNFYFDDGKRREDMPSNIPVTYSFTVGSQSGVSFSADTESLAEGLSEAVRLLQEKRFMEALKLSKGVFEYVRNQQAEGVIDKLEDESLRKIAYDAAYCAGFCLMELEKMTTASYYLEIAAHALNYKYVQEYINCLSNTRDLRALPFIENVISHSPRPTSPEDIKAWEFHMSFLKRRKAYVLIDFGRIAEARAYLTEMLDDPVNKDFAENELKYIDHSTHRP